MDQLDVTNSPLPWILLLLGAIAYVYSQRARLQNSIRQSRYPSSSAPVKNRSEAVYSESAYEDIAPLLNFHLDTEQPLKLRPFKPKYHMTMALENTTLNDLIAMDNTHRERLQIRKELIEKERYEVLACNPEAAPAILELYEWLTRTYLPRRFPSLYTVTESRTHLRNHVTDGLIPLHMTNGEEALEILGSNIDTEFLLLTSSSKSPNTSSFATTAQTKYVLTAFINCFPSGFNTRSKLNQLLAAIHNPVPGYAAKLEKSMDRFFANLPVGKIVKRSNWSISTNGQLFCLEGNHMTEEDLALKQKMEAEEEIDLDKTVLRCERQTLHRLPKTGALVFAFKTYQYPLCELRDEGSGEVLAEAIDGLGLGSVPSITVYKRQIIWGDKVKAFLKGEIDA
ncbi:hypothetical protein ACET3X_000610 [Alternaria dauci]|uniref:Uncharacterized protein n=1 Tax=Alternaria dauci TaxID=48095 RepID=A0ABR3UUW8_9PLEO